MKRWSIILGIVGLGLLWYFAGWGTTLAVFIIWWSVNLDRLSERK